MRCPTFVLWITVSLGAALLNGQATSESQAEKLFQQARQKTVGEEQTGCSKLAGYHY